MEKKEKKSKISILLPCFNEEKAIPVCLEKIQNVVIQNDLIVEVIVVDNGSTDQSLRILTEYQKIFPNLIVISEPVRGYGSAYRRGLGIASGEIFFMADMDNSYEFEDIPRFVEVIEHGCDLVVGNRFKGKMKESAMPFHHRYIGNPFLTLLVRLMFDVAVKDIHCGARAISKIGYSKLQFKSTGMEFASEMIIEAARKKIRIQEIPVNYNNRIGVSKLKSFSDGWRHLKLIIAEASKCFSIFS